MTASNSGNNDADVKVMSWPGLTPKGGQLAAYVPRQRVFFVATAHGNKRTNIPPAQITVSQYFASPATSVDLLKHTHN